MIFETKMYITNPNTGLPPDARSEDVNKFFEGYGHIVDCRVMTGRRALGINALTKLTLTLLKVSALSSSNLPK